MTTTTRLAYRIEEVADACGVSIRTVYRWMDRGRLNYTEIDGLRLVRAEDVQYMLNAPRTGAA